MAVEFAIETIPQNLQAIALMIPALACCAVQFKNRAAAVVPFETSNFFKNTKGINLPTFSHMIFSGHDHPINGVTPKEGELAVELKSKGLSGDTVKTVVVNKKNVDVYQNLTEGQDIGGTNHRHNHQGKNRIGPYEYL